MLLNYEQLEGKDCVSHLFISFNLQCLVHWNEGHFPSRYGPWFSGAKNRIISENAGSSQHLGKPGTLDWEVSCGFWRGSAFVTCWTLTERTKVEFSQDVILRLAPSSLIGAVHVNRPKVSGGGVSF